MRAWCIVATAALAALLALAGAGAAVLLRGGPSARAEPSPLEVRVARKLRGLAIPAAARVARNPVPRTPDVLAEAAAHFADHCASCHGNDGSGQTEVGRRLFPRAPDMRRPETQGLTDGELFYIIEHGVKLTGMPGWGGAGHADESWALVHFVRHLPDLAPEEKARMERLNPRSAEEWRELREDDAFLGEDEPAGQERHRHER